MHLNEKKYDFIKLKISIYKNDSAIKNGQANHWNLKIKIYMIFVLETLFWINLYPEKKINSNFTNWFSCTCHFCRTDLVDRLVHRRGL